MGDYILQWMDKVLFCSNFLFPFSIIFVCDRTNNQETLLVVDQSLEIVLPSVISPD